MHLKVGLLKSKTMPQHFLHYSKKTSIKSRKPLSQPPNWTNLGCQCRQKCRFLGLVSTYNLYFWLVGTETNKKKKSIPVMARDIKKKNTKKPSSFSQKKNETKNTPTHTSTHRHTHPPTNLIKSPAQAWSKISRTSARPQTKRYSLRFNLRKPKSSILIQKECRNTSQKPLKKLRKNQENDFLNPTKWSKTTTETRQNEQIFDRKFRFFGSFINLWTWKYTQK